MSPVVDAMIHTPRRRAHTWFFLRRGCVGGGAARGVQGSGDGARAQAGREADVVLCGDAPGKLRGALPHQGPRGDEVERRHRQGLNLNILP